MAEVQVEMLKQKQAAEQEVTNLEQQIAALENKISTLSEAMTQKRQQMQEAYRLKYAARFKDIDPAMALIGQPQIHKVKAFGAEYGIRPPTGEWVRTVDGFTIAPLTKGDDGKEENLGPISREDEALLKWLVTVKAPNLEERKIDKTPIATRLKLIRGLPIAMANQLRAECELLETFLSVSLELEIASGNS